MREGIGTPTRNWEEDGERSVKSEELSEARFEEEKNASAFFEGMAGVGVEWAVVGHKGKV